ncbi:MAG: hypothetical protein ACE5GL_09145, partial [Calditrichia bacterium]
MVRIFIIVFFFAAILLVSSCTNPFAPARADSNAPSSNLLTLRETPQDVLTNFVFAYNFKDSLVYSEIIDTNFVFLSQDFNQSPPVPIQWGRDLELRTTARMFNFFNTLDLSFNTPIYQRVTRDDTLQISPDLIIEKEIEMKLTFTLTLDGGKSIPTLNHEVIYVFFC